MSNTVYKKFNLHPDQQEIVEAALQHAKAKSGTEIRHGSPRVLIVNSSWAQELFFREPQEQP